MNISRPAVLLAASAATLALALSGCTSSAPAADETPLDAEQTINVWGWSSAPGADIIAKVIEGFEAEHPNITVNYVETAGEDFKPKLSLALSSGEEIDVAGVQPNAWATENQDYFTPVDEWPGVDGLVDKFKPATIEQNISLFSDGVLRSVPFGSSGSTVGIYNVDIMTEAGFTEAPKTWAEFAELSAWLKANKPDVLPMVNASDGWAQDETVLTLVGQTDPGFFNAVRYDDGPWNTPAYVAALTRYAELFNDGTLDQSTLDLTYSDANSLFDQGKAAVLFTGSWEANRLLASYREANGLAMSDVGIMGLPADNADDVSLRAFLDITYGIPEASSKKAAAAAFIEYATAGPGVDIWASISLGFAPALEGWSLPEDALTTDVERASYALLGELIANPSSDRNNLSNFSNQVGTYVIPVIKGDLTPEEAAAKGQADRDSGLYE